MPTPSPEGGGVLSLEKGTDCSPTAGEQWLSRPAKAKKGGGSPYIILYSSNEAGELCVDGKKIPPKNLILYCRIGELSESVQLIFHIK